MTDPLPNRFKRYPLVDYIRGFAVVLMVIFHAAYDLTIFGYLQINFMRDIFWFALPRVIVFLFLLSVGAGLYLAHKPNIKWRPFWKRFSKVALCALIISLYTYYAFPAVWVYFGTLHCIAITSLLALPFLNYPKVSLVTGLTMLCAHLFFDFGLPWFSMPHKSMDYIPAFPWLGVVLLGIFATHQGWHKWEPKEGLPLKILKYLGIHSFLIYMLHQPILYGLVFAFNKFTH